MVRRPGACELMAILGDSAVGECNTWVVGSEGVT